MRGLPGLSRFLGAAAVAMLPIWAAAAALEAPAPQAAPMAASAKSPAVVDAGSNTDERPKSDRKIEVLSGPRLELRPDGMRVEWRADGSRLESRRDGSSVETLPDGTTIFQLAPKETGRLKDDHAPAAGPGAARGSVPGAHPPRTGMTPGGLAVELRPLEPSTALPAPKVEPALLGAPGSATGFEQVEPLAPRPVDPLGEPTPTAEPLLSSPR